MKLIKTNDIKIDGIIQKEEEVGTIYDNKLKTLPLSVGLSRFGNFSVLTNKNLLLSKDGGKTLERTKLLNDNGLNIPTNSSDKHTSFPKGNFSWSSEFTGTRNDPLSIDPDEPYIFPHKIPNGLWTLLVRMPKKDINEQTTPTEGSGSDPYGSGSDPYGSDSGSDPTPTPSSKINFYDLEIHFDETTVKYNYETSVYKIFEGDDGSGNIIKDWCALIKVNDNKFIFISNIEIYIKSETVNKHKYLTEICLPDIDHDYSITTTKTQFYIDENEYGSIKIHFFKFFLDTMQYGVRHTKFKEYVFGPNSYSSCYGLSFNNGLEEVPGEFPGEQIFFDVNSHTAFVFDRIVSNNSTSKFIYQFDMEKRTLTPLQSLEYDIMGNLVSQTFDGCFHTSKDGIENDDEDRPEQISSLVFIHNTENKVVSALFTINDRIYQIKRSVDRNDSSSELLTDFVILRNSSLDNTICSVYDNCAPINNFLLPKPISEIMLSSKEIIYNISSEYAYIEREQSEKMISHIFDIAKRKTKIICNGILLKTTYNDYFSNIDDFSTGVKEIRIISGTIKNKNIFIKNLDGDKQINTCLIPKTDFIEIYYITLKNGDSIIVTSIMDSTVYKVPFMINGNDAFTSELTGSTSVKNITKLIRSPLDSYDVYQMEGFSTLLIYNRSKDAFFLQECDVTYNTNGLDDVDLFFGANKADEYLGSDVETPIAKGLDGWGCIEEYDGVLKYNYNFSCIDYYNDPDIFNRFTINQGLSGIGTYSKKYESELINIDESNMGTSFLYQEGVMLNQEGNSYGRGSERMNFIFYIPKMINPTLAADTPVQPFHVFEPFINYNVPFANINDNYDAIIKLGTNRLYQEDILVKVSVDGVLNESLNKLFDNGFSPADEDFTITVPNLAPGEHTISFEAESITTPARTHATFSKTFTIKERVALPTNLSITRNEAENSVTVAFDTLDDQTQSVKVYVGGSDLDQYTEIYDENGLLNNGLISDNESFIETYEFINPETTYTFEGLTKFLNKDIRVLFIIKDSNGVKACNKQLDTLVTTYIP